MLELTEVFIIIQLEIVKSLSSRYDEILQSFQKNKANILHLQYYPMSEFVLAINYMVNNNMSIYFLQIFVLSIALQFVAENQA